MFDVCLDCGMYHEDKYIKPLDAPYQALAICPNCQHPHPFLRLPLFIITGASGAGKTAVCHQLASAQSAWIALEADILWRDEWNQPDNDYYAFRNLWLRMAKNIQQSGKPIMLCGSSTPGQNEQCKQARYFSEIYYLALVCDADILMARLQARPGWREFDDPAQIQVMQDYNQWFIDNAEKYQMTLVDTSHISVDHTVKQIQQWFFERYQPL